MKVGLVKMGVVCDKVYFLFGGDTHRRCLQHAIFCATQMGVVCDMGPGPKGALGPSGPGPMGRGLFTKNNIFDFSNLSNI